MKKTNVLLVLLTSLLISCGETTTSNKESEVVSEKASEAASEVASESKETIISSSEESVSVSESSTEELIETKFTTIDDELYMLPNEEYYVNKMGIDKNSLLGVTYSSDNDALVSIDENGKLTAHDYEEEEDLVSTYINITRNNKIERIKVNVVDYEAYGSYKTSCDLGRLYNKKVVFFGDSITHNWSKYPSGNRPETQEEKAAADAVTSLGSNYIPKLNDKCDFASITNAGWSGGTMSYVPSSKERLVYKSFPGAVEDNVDAIANSDYFFVLYGTNDLTEQFAIDNHDEMTSLDGQTHSFTASMTYGVNRIREINPDAIIFFMSILYRTYPYSKVIPLESYNEAISSHMVTYRTKLIDTYSLITKETANKYLGDGLHPNDDGYKLMANYIISGQK